MAPESSPDRVLDALTVLVLFNAWHEGEAEARIDELSCVTAPVARRFQERLLLRLFMVPAAIRHSVTHDPALAAALSAHAYMVSYLTLGLRPPGVAPEQLQSLRKPFAAAVAEFRANCPDESARMDSVARCPLSQSDVDGRLDGYEQALEFSLAETHGNWGLAVVAVAARFSTYVDPLPNPVADAVGLLLSITMFDYAKGQVQRILGLPHAPGAPQPS